MSEQDGFYRRLNEAWDAVAAVTLGNVLLLAFVLVASFAVATMVTVKVLDWLERRQR